MMQPAVVPLTAQGVTIGTATINEDGTILAQIDLIDDVPWDFNGVLDISIGNVDV